MSDCERYEALISELLDGELSAAEEAEVRAHMAQCAECAAMYEAFSAAGAALRADASDVPATLHDGIMARISLAEKARKTQNKIIRLRPILTAAACVIVLAGTLLALKNTVGMRKGYAPETAEAPAALYAAEEAAADSVAAGGAGEEPKIMAAKKAAAEEAGAGEEAAIAESAMDIMEAPAEANAVNGAAAAPETEARKDAQAASGGTLYGADQVYPTVMVNGAKYEWHRGDAIQFSGLPDGCEAYGEIVHTEAETPQADGELASLFPVSGTIYTVPADETVVYLRLTTDWMENAVVQFDRCG